MSSPIHDGSISPNDPSYYAPRRSLADAKTPLTEQASSSAESPTDSGNARADDAEVIVPFPRAREYLNTLDRRTPGAWRTKALVASGIAVIVLAGGIWLFGSATITPQLGEKQPKLEPALSLASRLQTAAVDIQKASQQLVTPTLVVGEPAGDVNTPLALGLEVKNYMPGAVVTLSDLPVGTSINKEPPIRTDAGGFPPANCRVSKSPRRADIAG